MSMRQFIIFVMRLYNSMTNQKGWLRGSETPTVGPAGDQVIGQSYCVNIFGVQGILGV